jgi:Bacteriophage Lambda NinG protein
VKRSPLTRKAPLRTQGNPTASVPVFRPRKCKVCKTSYTPRRAFECWCSPECGLAVADQRRAKAEAAKAKEQRAADNAKRESLKSKAELANDAQAEVNRYVRLRDMGKPCISCGSLTAETYQAGHYLSRGARPELRFDLDNIHAQCVHCNMHKGGNISEYRPRLIERIGLERVERLEGPHPMPRWTREDLAEIKARARAMARELKGQK